MSDFSIPPSEPPARRRRWASVLLVGLLALALVVLLAAVVASRINLNYYAISPGQAQEVAPLVTVPPARAHPVHGSLLLTDVYVGQVSALQYLQDKLDPDTELVRSSELTSPGIPAEQLTNQGYLEMAQSQDFAKTAALTRLGYRVGATDAGTVVFAVASGVPASSVLQVGDVITAVDGTPTPTLCGFVAQLHRLAPGDQAHLTLRQADISSDGVVRTGPTVQRSVTMAPAPKDQPASGCPGVVGPAKAILGVEGEQQVDYRFPFPVSVNTEGIGGPSAGLAMTLGIIDRLSNGRLTGSRVVAATGTIDPQDQVGPVGGVPQKTVAVENAGATVFMVPPAQYGDALSKATATLHVCRVSTLGQALGVLAHFGGAVPATLHPAPFRAGTCT